MSGTNTNDRAAPPASMLVKNKFSTFIWLQEGPRSVYFLQKVIYDPVVQAGAKMPIFVIFRPGAEISPRQRDAPNRRAVIGCSPWLQACTLTISLTGCGSVRGEQLRTATAEWIADLKHWATFNTLTFRDPRRADVAVSYWRRLVQVLTPTRARACLQPGKSVYCKCLGLRAFSFVNEVPFFCGNAFALSKH